MRPPQFAGEDGAAQVLLAEERLTSMRPPQFAGEDVMVKMGGEV